MVILREAGKKLVNPSCLSDADISGPWMAGFMGRIRPRLPDYIGLHYYGTDVAAAIQYFNSVYNNFPTIPVVVSEIASISRDYSQVLSFTAELANWMDSTDWVFEYGFMGFTQQPVDEFVSPQAQLMNPDGSFSDLGMTIIYDQPIKG